MSLAASRGAWTVRSKRLTLSDSVAAEIENRVLTGDLRPGERLPTEIELCDLLGVSRSVVRDAIRTLSARGLIRVRQGIGIVVAHPTDGAFSEALMAMLVRSDLTMGEVIDARSAIETRLVGLAAARGSLADWDLLDSRLESFADALAAREWENAFDAHLAFHRSILRAVHLPALELMLKPMQQFILVTSIPPRVDDTLSWELSSHYPIVEALRQGCIADAEAAMNAHFSYMEAPRYKTFRTTRFRDAATLEAWETLRSKIESRITETSD